MADHLAVILIAALAVIGVTLVILHAMLLRKLRTDHHNVWAGLGRPRLWFARTVRETANTLRFVWRREYRAIGDAGLDLLAGSLRIVYAIFAAVFFAAAATMVWSTIP